MADNLVELDNQTCVSWQEQLLRAWRIARQSLEAQQQAGHWTGRLSTSALSTATAISALVMVRNERRVALADAGLVDAAIAEGCDWLIAHQNDDGGFGDTDRSYSNIATTYLVLAAWALAAQDKPEFTERVRRQQQLAWKYVDANGRWEGLRKRYGKDKTFVVPILSNCAMAGLVPWSEVPALPFEAAWLPQDLYRLARMPVVSYAIPALVAIGQARFHKCPPWNALTQRIRAHALQPTLRVLRNMQPASGGYLEAVPLTSFVLMNLAAVGNGMLPVAQHCLRFILDSRLEDGSWPIDTNLATWTTSLSIGALASSSQSKLQIESHPTAVLAGQSEPLVTTETVRWLLRCQHTRRHPFTGATPGGWGWTDLSGAVPDADDTPAALLALHALDVSHPDLQRLQHQLLHAVAGGLRWLLRLQNRDGGWPTFCRGWGKLPFDRSGTDLTAHALRAIQAWEPQLDQLRKTNSCVPSLRQLRAAHQRGLRFLARNQRSDGSWIPLWFGNQDRSDEDNPVYGTGKVLLAYAALGLETSHQAEQGIRSLRRLQNPDGGWGGGAAQAYPFANDSGSTFSTASERIDPELQQRNPSSVLKNMENCSSVEETSIALEGLIQCGGDPGTDATIMRGLSWLVGKVEQGAIQHASPIGFYFAKLWYYEQLYPAIYSLSALGAALRKFGYAQPN